MSGFHQGRIYMDMGATPDHVTGNESKKQSYRGQAGYAPVPVKGGRVGVLFLILISLYSGCPLPLRGGRSAQFSQHDG